MRQTDWYVFKKNTISTLCLYFSWHSCAFFHWDCVWGREGGRGCCRHRGGASCVIEKLTSVSICWCPTLSSSLFRDSTRLAIFTRGTHQPHSGKGGGSHSRTRSLSIGLVHLQPPFSLVVKETLPVHTLGTRRGDIIWFEKSDRVEVARKWGVRDCFSWQVSGNTFSPQQDGSILEFWSCWWVTSGLGQECHMKRVFYHPHP